MGLTLTQVRDNTNYLLQNSSANDLNIISQAHRDRIIRQAVKKYSRVRPIITQNAMTGASDSWYTLPTDYEQGFSYLQYIEYPIEQTPPEYINKENYNVSLMDSVYKLRFLNNKPATGETFWVTYTKRHSFDSSGDSEIPIADLDALSYLSASLICKAFANFYAAKGNPSIPNTEVVSYVTRRKEYENQSKTWMDMYNSEITDDVTGDYDSVSYLQDQWFNRSDS